MIRFAHLAALFSLSLLTQSGCVAGVSRDDDGPSDPNERALLAEGREPREPREPGDDPPTGGTTSEPTTPCPERVFYPGNGLRCHQFGDRFDQPLLVVEPFDGGNESAHAYTEALISPFRSAMQRKHGSEKSCSGSTYGGCFFDYCVLDLPRGDASLFTSSTFDYELLSGIPDQAKQVENALETMAGLTEPDVCSGSGYYDPEKSSGDPGHRKRKIMVIGLSAGGITSTAAVRRREVRGKPRLTSAIVTVDSPMNGAQIQPGLQRLTYHCGTNAQKSKLSSQPARELLQNWNECKCGGCALGSCDCSARREHFDGFAARWRAMGNQGYPMQTDLILLANSHPSVTNRCHGRNKPRGCFDHHGATGITSPVGPHVHHVGELSLQGEGLGGIVERKVYLSDWDVKPGSVYQIDSPDIVWFAPFTFVLNESALWASFLAHDYQHAETVYAHDDLPAVNFRTLEAYALEYLRFDADGAIDFAKWGGVAPGKRTLPDHDDRNPRVQ